VIRGPLGSGWTEFGTVRVNQIIRSMYAFGRCAIPADNGIRDRFQVFTGVRQGCVLSPLLFAIAIDWIMKRVNEESNFAIKLVDQKSLSNLDFADDIGLLSHSC
jgi:hypothetical protein